MRPRIPVVAVPSEVGDFADEIRRVFLELGRAFGSDALAGECSPAIDVYETDDSVEIAVDLPGVDQAVVRVMSKADSILIVGEKPPKRVQGESTFHLVERGYGRFARVVGVGLACDIKKARAMLSHGELHISLPKIADRRGRTMEIAVSSPAPHA